MQVHIDTLSYLPEHLRTNETILQVVDLIDHVHEHEYGEFEDALSKYAATNNIQSAAAYQIIAESGYDYIPEILEIPESMMRVIAEYIKAIHALKGTRTGLELVLGLLNLTHSIEEWWEQIPRGTEYTFEFTIEYLPEYLKVNTQELLEKFVRNYVYPIAYYRLYYRQDNNVYVAIQQLTAEDCSILPLTDVIVASFGNITVTAANQITRQITIGPKEE